MRHGPPRHPATGGDALFALGVAALGLVLAGGLLAAGGGSSLLDRILPGGSATAGPVRPSPSPSAAAAPGSPRFPAVTPVATPPPSPTPVSTSTPTPAPTGPFTMNLYRDGVFVHQVDDQTCVAAAAQNMLNVIRLVEEGQEPDSGTATQRALYDRIVKLTTWEDSHNGGTGPGGWAALLTEEGYPYEVRAYESRLAAMRAAAAALRATSRPVGIIAWKGIHSWVITGFRATADPAFTMRFAVTEAYVLDPWYPWISTRWPRSEAPNEPRDGKDLTANILAWNLPSGPYEGRDGMFLLVVPVDG
ncbi:MAG: hypothetical protein V2B17_00690 [Chloroflexota bacterium]